MTKHITIMLLDK